MAIIRFDLEQVCTQWKFLYFAILQIRRIHFTQINIQKWYYYCYFVKVYSAKSIFRRNFGKNYFLQIILKKILLFFYFTYDFFKSEKSHHTIPWKISTDSLATSLFIHYHQQLVKWKLWGFLRIFTDWRKNYAYCEWHDFVD